MLSKTLNIDSLHSEEIINNGLKNSNLKYEDEEDTSLSEGHIIFTFPAF